MSEMSETKTKKQKVNAVWSVVASPIGLPMLHIAAWTPACGGQAAKLAGSHCHALDPESVGIPEGYFICKIFDRMQDEIEALLDVQIINARARDMASLVRQYQHVVQRKAIMDREAGVKFNNSMVGVGGLLGALGVGGMGGAYGGGGGASAAAQRAVYEQRVAHHEGYEQRTAHRAQMSNREANFDAQLRAAELTAKFKYAGGRNIPTPVKIESSSVADFSGGLVSGTYVPYGVTVHTVTMGPPAMEVRPDSVMDDDDLGVVVHTYLNGSTVILKRKDTGESLMVTAAQYDFIRASVGAVKKARAEARLAKEGAEPDDAAADEEDAMVW